MASGWRHMAAVSASERDYGDAMGEEREKVREFDPEPRESTWHVMAPRVQGRSVTPDQATISLLIPYDMLYCMFTNRTSC